MTDNMDYWTGHGFYGWKDRAFELELSHLIFVTIHICDYKWVRQDQPVKTIEKMAKHMFKVGIT